MRFKPLFIYLLLTCPTIAASNSELDFGGFISQGITYTSDNSFFEAGRSTSLKMTTIAVQSNYLLQDKVRFSGQLMYRNWGELESLRIDYLMADYQFYNTDKLNLGFRLGRIKSDLGLFNSTRDIPSARPSIFLPQSVYQDTLRDTTTSYDGISLYGNRLFPTGRLNLSVAYGEYPVSSDLSTSIFGKNLAGKITTDANWQLNSSWESKNANWLFSLGFENPNIKVSRFNNLNEFTSLTPGEAKFDRYIFSGQYFAENWDLSIEYIHQKWQISGFQLYLIDLPEHLQPANLPDVLENTFSNGGFYSQYRYMLNDDITLMFRLGRYYIDNDDKNGSRHAKESGDPAFSRYHKDLVSAIKWQITPQWQLSLEAHLLTGTASIAPTVKYDHSDNNKKHWQMWSLQMAYSF